jgi:hypothetical protein
VRASPTDADGLEWRELLTQLSSDSVSVKLRPPLVYLDHWALRRLSRRDNLGERKLFLDAFKERGTLMFSPMNMVELAGNSGDSMQEMRGFLDDLANNWLLSELDPETAHEALRRGVPQPECFMVPKDVFRVFLQESQKPRPGSFLLGATLGFVESEQFKAMLERREATLKGLLELLEKRREALRDGRLPSAPRGPKGWPLWILDSLMAYLAKEKKKLSINDVRDLFHAVLPLTFGQVVTLDGAWASLASKLKLEDTFIATSRNFAEGLARLETVSGGKQLAPRPLGLQR